MIAELNVGHAYVQGGDTGPSLPSQAMGYLGADFESMTEGNAYRIAKLFAGDLFELDQRSPLLTPGTKVRNGDYILAVGGQPVRADQDLQALLVGTAGRVIALSVNDKPTMEGARQVFVKPLASENKLRYFDWVASRAEYVRKHGGENFGYLHLPDMVNGGMQEFAKHYYAQLRKDAMIYDVRNNGGGFISALLLLQMSSKPYAYFKPRQGASWTRVQWGFAGHSVALCNENSGSNAEEFCDGFQRLKLGPVIGVRTWGGEVGSGSGYPLIDGGRLFIPNYAAWSPDGKWIIEGNGVQPDLVVENDPASLLQGRDPQLDRAIAYLKEKLAKQPVVRPTPPPFPNKAPKTK
jgi:tricorn protease